MVIFFKKTIMVSISNERIGGLFMKKIEISKLIAYFISKILVGVLFITANSASTFIIHQPKVPNNIDRFKLKNVK